MVEVQDYREITDHFRGIYRIYPNLVKEKGEDVNRLCPKIFLITALKCLWPQIASLIPKDGKLSGGHSDKFTERNFYYTPGHNTCCRSWKPIINLRGQLACMWPDLKCQIRTQALRNKTSCARLYTLVQYAAEARVEICATMAKIKCMCIESFVCSEVHMQTDWTRGHWFLENIIILNYHAYLNITLLRNLQYAYLQLTNARKHDTGQSVGKQLG